MSPRTALALLLGALLCLAALALGVGVGLAGRVVYLLGLGPLVLSVLLGVLSVARWHLLRTLAPRWRVAAWSAALAVLAVAAARGTDVWGLYQSQLTDLTSNPEAIATDLVVAGLREPRELLDAGLRVETGRDGLAGAWLLQLKTGLVVHRAGRLERVLPLPAAAQALVFGLEVALVTLLLFRTQEQLRHQRRCAACGRFLRRTVLGGVSDAAAAVGVLEQGQLPALVAGQEGALLLVQEQCPLAHLRPAGVALVRPARRQLWAPGGPQELWLRAGQIDPLALHQPSADAGGDNESAAAPTGPGS